VGWLLIVGKNLTHNTATLVQISEEGKHYAK
jgi:hypothetical protein